MITWIALFLFEITAAGYCRNGLGGKFPCRFGMSDEAIARAACRSVYSACKKGRCGYFYYYYHPSHKSCSCSKKFGTYEFIYKNLAYGYVGQDYRGKSFKVARDDIFVRKRTGHCNKKPWTLVTKLGEDIPIPTPSPTENPSNKPTENPTNIPTGNPTNRPTENPTNIPTGNPTNIPTLNPTNKPTENPTNKPTENPTNKPTENPTNKPTENPTNKPTENLTNKPTEVPSRIPCKDQFSWCVYPNICDNDDFRQYCPFSCDDCLTAGPTTMPTASPTEDCAAREDILEGVIDHMLNHYLKNEED